MTSRRPWAAFYAPMKPPDHPSPSGDREIARLTVRALEAAGFAPRTVSTLRTLDTGGDADIQADLRSRAKSEIERLISALAKDPPEIWFTYHCHYKAPDLIGPAVSSALGLRYVISEPSISPRRRQGPWAGFATASEAAISAADHLFWTTRRDEPALLDAGHGAKMTHLPAFLDPGPDPPAPSPASTPYGEIRLLAVAMMRPGDKLESYLRLAAALAHLDTPWHLDVYGDGPARGEVEAAMAQVADHVTYHGATEDRRELRTAYEAAHACVWPGVGEGVGMVYLEAQAAGTPVVAEDHPAQRDLIAAPLVVPDDPLAFASRIVQTARDRSLREQARSHVLEHHSLTSAAQILRDAVKKLC